MSRFASRRNFYAEEQVLLQELVGFLDAREVPSDPIRKAQFWADYYRGLTEPESGEVRDCTVEGRVGRRPAPDWVARGSGSVSPVQPALFEEEEAA